ncbi:MAG: ROK family protein, partial [Candidatus Dormibacteraeota bacterium]|nr:ROK family protein [Candidatus Dormibacteraeota bacterium]
ESPRATVRRIAGGLRALMAQEGLARERVAGLGVGAVGLVDPGQDTVRTAPNLGWTEVPLGPWLAEELETPVVVRNNVHGMAAGELRVRGVPEPCALYVYVGFGIGGAVVAGGSVLEGAHGAAGEVGHLAVRGGGPCTCGKTGCLETVASERVLAERARSLVGGEPGLTKPSVRRLVDLAEAGEMEARRVVDQAARALGEALAQAVEILDVAAIIVSGELARARATVLEPLAATLRESVFAVRGRHVEVRATEIANPGLVGAATLALDAFVFHPEAEILAERVSAPMLRGAVS